MITDLQNRTVQAKVAKPCRIYEENRKAGDTLKVDSCTFRNLVKKGILVEAGK